MSRRRRAAAPARGPARSGIHDQADGILIEVVAGCEADHLLPSLDAALVGWLCLDDPATTDVGANWLEEPKWEHAARALLRHRRAGGVLGDVYRASRVLRDARVDFAATLAAEAILATLESAPARVVVAAARDRRPRLDLRRLAQLLLVTAAGDRAAIPAMCAVACRTLEEIAREAQS